MTNEPRTSSCHRQGRLRPAAAAGAFAASLSVAPALAFNPAPNYPFEGTWVRADRVCTATAPQARTYSSREMSTSAGRCTYRKVVLTSGQWEIFEECHRPDRSNTATETVRMLGPDTMLLKRQVVRLKIPHGRRYQRCAIAGRPAPTSSSNPDPDR